MATDVQSRGFEYGVKHFLSSKKGQLDEILVETLNLPLSEANFLISLGAVYVQQTRTTQPIFVESEKLIRVHTKPRRFATDYNWSERIVFEDRDFIVVNKPSSMPSHPAVDNILDNSLTAVSLFCKTPLFITHRLDSLTEGLIVYSKSALFTKTFNELLAQQQIEKKYVALIQGSQPIDQKLIHYMEPSPRAPKKVSPHFIENWSYCELIVEDQKTQTADLWVRLNLITGRTHQIRAQMSQLARPLLGDQLYGSMVERKNEKGLPAIALRAQEIEFTWAQKVHQFQLSDEL